MTDAPQTVAGALRAYVAANLPAVAVFRNSTPPDQETPVAVIKDPLDTVGSDLGDDLLLTEQVQVDLYLDASDAGSTADALHALLHRAPISVPGSQIHRVQVLDRRIDTSDVDDDGIIRVIYTVEVRRRVVAGDGSTPLPFPVRPDRLEAHEAKTTNVHGIANTAELETQTGAQAKADNALAAAAVYTDATVGGAVAEALAETRDYIDAQDAATLASATAAASSAANAYTDSEVAEALLTANATAQEAADGALTAANAYTDDEVATVLSAALAGADAVGEAVLGAANTYTDDAVADALAQAETLASDAAAAALTAANAYTDTQVATAVPNAEKGAAGGVATLNAEGKVPSAQLPPLAISDTFVVASEAAMLALAAERGDIAIRTDLSRSFILREEPATTAANWQEFSTPPDSVLSVDGRAGTVSLADLYDAAGSASAAQAAAKTYADSTFTPLTDPRLTDQRTPLDGSVTTAKIAAGAVTGTRLALGAVSDATISSTAAIAPSKLGSGGAATGQALVWNGTAWVPGTVSPARATASVTTASLAPGAVANTSITLARGYRLLAVQVSGPARVRLYTTAAARTADATRVEGADPAWNAGVVADLVLPAGALSGSLSPVIDGANLEASPSASIPVAITNRGAADAAITLTVTYLPQEA